MPDTQGGLTRPRRRWRRALLVAFLLLAAAAVAVFLGSGPRLDAWARARLRVELARALGRPVSVGEVHVSLVSSSFIANDIIVGEVPPGRGRVLEVPQVAGTIRLRSLLRNRLELQSLHVLNPKVTFAHRGGILEGPIPIRRRGLVARATGALKVVLRRLEIDNGTVSFDDRTAPFWCRADAIQLVWQGDELGNGSGSLKTDTFTGGSGEVAELGNLRIEAVLQGGDFSGRLEAAWPAGSARADAAITLPSSEGAPATGTIRGVAHLEEGSRNGFVRTLLHLDERLEGTLDVKGSVSFRGSDWRGQGHVDGRHVRYADLSAETVSAEVKVGDGKVDLSEVDLRALGGRVTGQASIATVKGGAVQVSAHADGLDLKEVLATIGLPAPLTGALYADGTLAAKLGDPASLQVRAATRVAGTGAARAGPPASRRYPVTGQGTVAIDGRLVVFTADRLTTPGVAVSVRVEKPLDAPETRLHLGGDLASLAEGSALVESFIAMQPDGSSLPWDSGRLAGSGTVDGDFVFRKNVQAKGHVTFAFRDFAYERIGGASVSGTALADGAEFSFSVPRAEKSGGTLSLEGRFPEGHRGLSQITGDLKSWPVEDVLARIGAPAGATARGTGPLVYRFDGSASSGETRLKLADVKLGDVAFADGDFEAALREGRIDVARLALAGPQGTLTASGSYAIDAGALTGTLEASHVDAQVAGPWLKGVPLAGHASVSASLQRKDGGPAWTARVIPEDDLTFSGRPIREIRLDVTGDANRARYEGVFGELARFSGAVDLAAPHRGEGRFELVSVPITPLLSLSNPDLALQTGGELTGTIEWSGPVDELNGIVAIASFTDVRLALGAESFETARPAVIRLEGGLVKLEDVELVSGPSKLTVHGSYPLEETGAVDVTIDGSLDLGAVSAFVPELSASGDLRASVRVSGLRAEPRLAGTFEVDKGRLRLIDFPLVADRIHLSGRLDESGLTADGITAVLGGGSFSGDGHVDLEGVSVSAFHLQGRVANAALALPEGFRGQYSGGLRFEQKKGETPVLSGNLELVRGIWLRNFNLDSLSFGQRVRPPVFQVSAPGEGLTRTRLDLKIQADDNVWCHNDLADVEGAADLALMGTVAAPQLTGRYDAFEGGEMRFRRVRYIIDQAAVTFPPGSTFNPEYDITAETQVRDYEVRMHLAGNLDTLEYELTSNPPLPQQQILALLVTGVASPDEAVIPSDQLANQAASVVGGEIGGLVGGQLEKWLGIEEIRIEPFVTSSASATTDPTTRVTLGKRISPRVFVRTAVALNSPEDPIYQVEYALSRKVRLTLERGELGSVGGGVRYGTRFFLPSVRREGEAKGTVPKRPVSRRIGEVRFLGDADLDGTALRRVAHVRQGKEFTRQRMVEGADRLKRYFVKKEYLEASVRPALHEGPDGLVDVEYTVEKGPKVVVDVVGAGIYERRIRDTLKSLWQESSFGGDFAGEAEDKIRRVLQEEGFYACLIEVRTEEAAGTKRLTFRIDTGEKVTVESIELKGVRSLTETEVRRQILTAHESLFRRPLLVPSVLVTDVSSIENLYRSKGFLSVAVRSHVALSPDARRAFVTIDVVEGPASILRTVTIAGASAIPLSELMPLVKSKRDDPFFPAQVVADRDAIRRRYDAAGYPEAKVEEEVVREGERVDLTYRVTEGPPRRVASIAVDGNTLTQEAVILREVTLHPGDPISGEKMRQTRQNLMHTGLYADAQIRYEPAPSGTEGQILRVHVNEAENIVLGLGGGYDTVNGPRASVELADVNLFGSGRYAGISAIYGGKLERGQITFKEPHVFGQFWSATLSTFYEKRERPSFSQRQLGSSLLLERKTASPVRHYLRYSEAVSEVFDVQDLAAFQEETSNKVDLGRLRLASIGYGIIRDTRNDPFAATRGTYANADLRAFARPIGSEKQFEKLFLQGSYYRKLPLGLIWSTELRIGAGFRREDEAIPLQERYFAGGDSTVRGFRQDRLGYVDTEKFFRKKLVDPDGDGTFETKIKKQVLETGTLTHGSLLPLGGEGLVISNNELRHKLFGGLSASAFLDVGNTYPRAGDVFSGRFRYAGGLGLRYDTPVGPLRLEYGRKIDRERGESPGEFVLSLGQTF